MAANYASSNDAQDFDNGSITVTKPSGTTSGDLLIAVVDRYEDSGNSASAFTAPGGWSEDASSLGGDHYRIKVFSKEAGGSEPASYTFTYGSPGDGYGANAYVARITGANTSTIYDDGPTFAGSTSSSSNIVAPSVSPAKSDSLLMCGWIYEENFTDRTLSAPSGMTIFGSYPDVGGLVELEGGYEQLSSSGATGTKSAPLSSGTVTYQFCVSMAILSTIDISGSMVETDSITGGIEISTAAQITGTIAETAGFDSIVLNLAAGETGSVALTSSITGGITVISRNFTSALEVELTDSVWTDITDYLNLGSGSLTIRQGRATPYDEISPGVMTFSLWNDDGRFMPENATSTYYPNWTKHKRVRWKVTKSSVTYTRFVGWIQSISPEYPSDTINGSIVNVTAIDELGLLSQRKMRSVFTEICLWRAANDTVNVDVYEASGKTTGNVAILTNYSEDSGAQSGNRAFSGQNSPLSFSSSNDVSFGDIVSSSGELTNTTLNNFQASPLQVVIHIKLPDSQVPAASTYYVTATYWETVNGGGGGGSGICNLTLVQNGSANDIALRNADNTSTIFTFGTASLGGWVKIAAYQNSTTSTHSDWYYFAADGSSTWAQTDVAVDITTVRCVEFPQGIGPLAQNTSAGGIMAIGTTTAISLQDSFSGLTWGTLTARLASIATILGQYLPVSFYGVGTLTSNVATGKWSGRYALDVVIEMLNTYSGLPWSRSRDSDVYCIGSDSLYPSTVIANIDVDGDCEGTPRLIDGAESEPTRVDVSYVGGTATYVDTATEATGISRSHSLSTIALTESVAKAAGQEIISRLSGGLRISEVTVDLIRGAVDHTSELFDESGTLTGLFPSARIRLYVPSSHFGVATRDAHVQGWTETYAYEGVTVRLDTTPAASVAIASESWTGSDSSAWAAQWVAGVTGTAATVDIQSNRGRIIVATEGFTSRRLNISTVTDVDITCLVNVGSGGEAGIFWHETGTTGDTSALQAGIDGTNLRVYSVTSSVYTSKYTGGSFSVATDYYIRARHQGTQCQVKAWAASGSEPGAWDYEFTETSFTGPGYVGVYGKTATISHAFDNYSLDSGA